MLGLMPYQKRKRQEIISLLMHAQEKAMQRHKEKAAICKPGTLTRHCTLTLDSFASRIGRNKC